MSNVIVPTPASLKRRFLSSTFDLLFIGVLYALIIWRVDNLLLEQIICDTFLLVYWVTLQSSTIRGTLGQKIFKVYVGTLTGEKLNFKESLIRYLMVIAPIIPLMIISYTPQYFVAEELGRELLKRDLMMMDINPEYVAPPYQETNFDLLVKILGVVGVSVGILMTLPIFRKDKVTLYDRWSHTRVYQKPQKS